MQLRAFYEHVLPATGHYTLFKSSSKRHLWADSLDELVELTAAQSGTDIYFATATFDEPTSRTQVNVDLKHSFYLDLDAGAAKLAKHGPEKTYETQRDALQGVRSFITATGLVPTLVVSSGEGLHLYWELSADVPGVMWTPVAKSFQKFGSAHGLKIDSSVTADSARVLRPVGTTHPNGKEVSVLAFSGKTYTLAEFAAAVGQETDVLAAAPKYDLSINDDVIVQGPPKSMKKLLTQCGAARYAAANQDSIDEPFWRAMIGLAKHTTEGRDAAHALSCRHPEYDEAATNDKYDRWATGPTTCERFAEFTTQCAKCPHQGKIKSPIQLGAMTVTEVEKLPPELQPPPPPAPKPTTEPWNDHIPQGFDVIQYKGKRTLVNYMDVERENEDGDAISTRITVPVSHEIFWLGHWADAAHADDYAQATVFRLDENKRVSTFTMDQSIVASRAELSKFYAGKGIHTSTDKRALTAMEAFTKASLQLIKTKGRRPKIHDRMGLVILPDGQLICAQGKYAIMPDGTITETILSPALRSVAERYHIPLPHSDDGTWKPTVWREHIKPMAEQHVAFMKRYYSDPGMAKYQLAFMLGLSSPLMAFVDGGYTSGTRLPRNGLSVALYSRDGGRGKTTVMKSALLAYGRPGELNSDANKVGSTDLGRTSTMSLAGTMPVSMDEMGSTDDIAMAGLISAVANGASRTRATKEGGLVNSAPWALIAMMATNRSARDMVNAAGNESNAIQYRMLEIDVDNMPEFDIESRVRFDADWSDVGKCAGALGALIHLAICKLGAQAVSDLVRDKVAHASRLLMSVQGDRFQYRGLGAMLALQGILERLGLAMFNTTVLVDTFRVCHAAAGDYIKENVMTSNQFELLSAALHAMHPYTVVTKSETKRTKSSPQYDRSITGRIPDSIKVRYVIDSGTAYVSAEALRQWCSDNRVRQADLLHAARGEGIMVRVYSSSEGGGKSQARWAAGKNLLSGMEESTNSKVNCYAFSTRILEAKLGEAQFKLDDVVTAQMPPKDNVIHLHDKAA